MRFPRGSSQRSREVGFALLPARKRRGDAAMVAASGAVAFVPETRLVAADPGPLLRLNSGLQELQHGEHPAVLSGRRRQVELVEDARDVSLHGGHGHDESLGDPGVGPALGDQ